MQPTRQHSFTESQASVLLDLLRGLAALLVVLSHWRNIFFVDYGTLPPALHYPLLLPYLLTTNAHRSVVLFFVLSGYFISGSIFRMLKRGEWSWTRYLVHRVVRLWVVLLPSLLLCMLWDKTGLALHHAPALYAGLTGNHLMQDVRANSNFAIFLANLFFLQFRFPIYGSNTALWSLANEFWYYLLFPLFWVAIRLPQSVGRKIGLLVLFGACCAFVGTGILYSFPLWLCGTLLLWLPRCQDRSWFRAVACLLLIAALYGLPKHGWLGSDTAFAVITTACIWTMLGAGKVANSRSPFVVFARSLSRFSFTLYVAHLPFIMVLASLTVKDNRWVPSVRNACIACSVLAATLFYAWIVASLTEFRTDRVRGWVERQLRLTNDAPSPHERSLTRG